jgi:hypothetical protein
MKKWIIAALLTLGASQLQAENSSYGLGLKASTLGLGLELHRELNDSFNIRLGLNTYDHDEDYDDGGISYNGELELMSVGSYIDWHPFQGGFRLTGGLLYNGNEVTLKGKPTTLGTVNVGGTNYNFTNAQLNGKVEFNSIAPYLGMGWGNSFKGSRWSFLFDLGAMFQGSPDADLSTSGTVTVAGTNIAVNTATFQSDLAKETQELENDIEDLKIYPVVSLGLSYRF